MKQANAETCRPIEQWKVDWAQPADEAALLDLFRKAFNAEMPVEQWRWKYAASNPLGSIVRENDAIMAFYGAMPRDVYLFGELATAVQVGDVMVDPSRRGVMTRRGAFFLTASAFSEGLIGPGKPYCYAFGFPSERHYLLSERLGLSAFVDEVFEGTWHPLAASMPWSVRVRTLDESCLPCIDGLWRGMLGELKGKAVLVRDREYLQRRYLCHPTIKYSMLLVERRFSGKPLGLLVLRDHGDRGVELLDMIAPVHRMRSLVDIARRSVGQMRRNRLFAWMTQSVVDVLADDQCVLAGTGIKIPTFIWKQPEDSLRIRGHLWLMGGDADSR